MTALRTLALRLRAYTLIGVIRVCEYVMPHAAWGWLEAVIRIDA